MPRSALYHADDRRDSIESEVPLATEPAGSGYNSGMDTAEEYLKNLQNPLWYGEQDENGVDLSLIRANLKLSPQERLVRGDRALEEALRLLDYGRQQRETAAARKQAGTDR